MFEYGDEVQLTEDAAEYYAVADDEIYGLVGLTLTVVGVSEDPRGTTIIEVEEMGEDFSFYEYELEFA